MKSKDTKAVWWSTYKYAAPADWERFMENMAAEGWNIDRIRQSDSFRMVFHKTQPKKYRYVMDLNAFPKKGYRELYEDFGWKFMGRMASIYVWRREYTGERPEAFTDKASLEKRNANVMNVLRALIILMLAGIAVTTIAYAVFPQSFTDWIDYVAPVAIFAVMAVVLGVFLRKIYKKRDE